MAYTNNPYCTLAQVHSVLDLQTTADDSWISGDLIPQAQADIDQFCNRLWQTDGTHSVPATRHFDGNNLPKLLIGECMEVDQVLETNYLVVLGPSGTYQSQGATTIDITADCVLGPNRYVDISQAGWHLRRISGLPFGEGLQNYVVKGVFGNSNIPTDIARACVRLVAHYYKMRDSNYADTLSEQGGMRLHYKKAMPDDVVEILTQYKRVAMGSRS